MSYELVSVTNALIAPTMRSMKKKVKAISSWNKEGRIPHQIMCSNSFQYKPSISVLKGKKHIQLQIKGGLHKTEGKNGEEQKVEMTGIDPAT